MLQCGKYIKKFALAAFIISALFFVFVFQIDNTVKKSSKGMVYDIHSVPIEQTAMVLGARVYANGKMSEIFQDRVETAYELYESEKVRKILVSGDHSRKDYDEVDAAREYLLSKGVPDRDIFLDHAGFDTYDSIYRAKNIFQVDSMIVVTQNFHLPRALYIAKSLGTDAVGASSDLHIYSGLEYLMLREDFADLKAWLDVLLKIKPKYSGDAIPITGDSSLSRG